MDKQIGEKSIEDVQVMYVETDKIPFGIASAFTELENKIGSLKQRKFFGVMFSGRKYWAAVQIGESDDPKRLGLDTGTIPGGIYSCKKIKNWSMKTVSKEIPAGFRQIESETTIDSKRPYIEFYRSQRDLLLMAPKL